MVTNICPIENLIIVPLRPDDAEEMFAGLSDEQGYHFIPDEPPATIEALRERYVMLSSGGLPDGSEIWLNWIIRYGDENAAAGYTQATISGNDALIGYHVFPAFWRQGIGAASLTLTLEEVFARDDVTTARAFVDTRNIASVYLLEKLGFSRINTINSAEFFKNNYSNEYEYIYEKEKWISRPLSPDRY